MELDGYSLFRREDSSVPSAFGSNDTIATVIAEAQSDPATEPNKGCVRYL